MPASALIVDDDPDFLASLELLVKREKFEVQTAGSLEQARASLAQGAPDVVLLDLHLPDGDGLTFLREQGVLDAAEVIVITGDGTVESAVDALRSGAADYLCKPIDRTRLASCLRNVARTRDLKKKVKSLRGELRELGCFAGRIIGRSPVMQQLYDLIERVAPTEASVFVSGESGVGKELVAETIHRLSGRSEGPLLPINCGAMPANLIESELFGHERGSFTGADRRRDGCFERARGGTLFLDEIAEMPVELQVKLLRVLESRVFSRVGGNEMLEVNVRIIAASNRDPRKAVEERVLREDLFYRLNVFPIVVPPLRDRENDVTLLAEHFLDELNTQHGTSKRFTPVALDKLASRAWRGNVRELKNAVHRAFILGEADVGHEALVGPAEPSENGAAPETLKIRVGSAISDVERQLIEATMAHFSGDKARTAKALGISIKTLYARLNLYQAQRSSE